MKPRRWWLAPMLLATVCLSGCKGGDGADDMADGDGDVGDGDGDGEVNCDNGSVPGPTPRLVRLTHTQYDNAIRDLIGLDTNPSAAFIEDPAFNGYTNNAQALLVSDRLARDYRRAAEALGGELMADPTTLANLLGCEPSGDGQACAASFIDTFGLRVYRRPLSAAERSGYLTLWAAGNGLYSDGDPFEQGIRLVIEGMLQSPQFLYRVELSANIDAATELIALDSWELASRLSFMLWNSVPDDELLDAAAANMLVSPDGIETQARRMLEDPRARGMVRDFHSQWLQTSRYADLNKNAGLYPGWSPSIGSSLEEETQRFIEYVIFEMGGTYSDLMTSEFSFIDDQLAAVYGIEGSFGPEPVLHQFGPDDGRAGLLTQIGFLASRAYPDLSSPIHRGVFIQRQILCSKLPDPPGDADLELPEVDGEEIVTTRQQVELHTSPAYCQGCHASINPGGFAFEHYDAIGQWRDTENDVAIDASGSIITSATDVLEFTDAMDLVHQLGADETAQQCYLRNWFRYGYARYETPVDECTIDDLHTRLSAADYNVEELLVQMTLTESFRFRAQEEG
jgi:hypothetical protein